MAPALAFLLPLADHPQHPALNRLFIRGVGRVLHPDQVFDPGRDDLRQAQPGRVQQVQAELQASLRRGVAHQLELLLREAPLRTRQTAPGIELWAGVPWNTHCRPGVAHQVVLVDQEAIEVLQNAQRLALRRG